MQASAKPSPTNLTLDKRRALVALENDESIVIILADKGRSTVVLDYKNKVFDLLSDATTYTTLKKDPTSDDKKKVIDCLQKLEKEGVVDQRQHHRLYPGEAIPCLYGLPKIHKEGAPLRSIVSSINSVT